MDFFGIIGIPLGYMMWFIESIVHNYGWSLIIFVILTRVLIFPLSIKQQKNTAKMAGVSKKMKQLQKQFAKDKERFQQEQMKLYEDAGVNPMSGCLPMLVQMFLIFGIVDVIYKPLTHIIHVSSDVLSSAQAAMSNASSTYQLNIINGIQQGTLAPEITKLFDANTIEAIKNFKLDFLGINLGTVPSEAWGWFIIIPLVAFGTQVLYTLVMMRIQKENGQDMQGMMKWTMLLMPLLSLFMAFTMPSGIGIYWTVSNILMLGQSILLQKMYPPSKMGDPNSKDAIKQREKMKKKREKMQLLNERIAERNGTPIPVTSSSDDNEKKELTPEEKAAEKKRKETEKELANRRIAEARKRMAEKYGDGQSDKQ